MVSEVIVPLAISIASMTFSMKLRSFIFRLYVIHILQVKFDIMPPYNYFNTSMYPISSTIACPCSDIMKLMKGSTFDSLDFE